MNHNNAEYLTRQDHALTANSSDRGAIVHTHSQSDLSHNTLAKSTRPTSSHIESTSKVHSINHIVSSLSGHSGKIDSVRITPKPEVVNKNKNTAGGTSSSSTAPMPGSTHTGSDHHGHSGQHAGTGHGTGAQVNSGNSSQSGSSTQPTNKQTTNSGSQNIGSGQTSPTDSGKTQSNPTGSTGTPTNPNAPTNNPTSGYSYGAP